MKNKIYYAFIGQNATTGTPNAISGKLSKFGDLVAFSDMFKRDHFVAEYYNNNNPSIFAAKTNKHTAKSDYFAGQSSYVFNEYLFYVNQNVDEDYNSYFKVD